MLKVRAMAMVATCVMATLTACGAAESAESAVPPEPDEPDSMNSSSLTQDTASESQLDSELTRVLENAEFTGKVESTLETRLGRPINRELADLGRLLWFDKVHALHADNSCGGCHSPTNGFGDTQPIAIGVQNNNLVGPHRTGPRNQRRTPMVINAAFFPKLMWNGRFAARSRDPFDNSAGFRFPEPEGTERFPPNDPTVKHLLIAQGHIPPTELVEVAGFTGTRGTIAPDFDQFDDGLGAPVPPPDASGFRNEPIRQAVLVRLNESPEYRRLFGRLFPSVAAGGPIDFIMFGQAIAEFEFTLVFADAPIDRYARGDRRAMTTQQKRGALVFFGQAECVACHAVAGDANEMFSDFQNRVIGVPQIAPGFGVQVGNMIFDGPGKDEDFGLEQVTGNPADRYKFRSSPLRNIALQPAFFHNGAFTRLRDAITHHLNVTQSARRYDPIAAGVARDLRHLGPIEPVLARLDPILVRPIKLKDAELEDLITFVRDGLLDPRAAAQRLCGLVPPSVPSGAPPMQFEQCR
jgi:cytochrome c peroxidase